MFLDCVFEGGGIKGLSYVGALRYLESRGYRIFRACGSSVGALFASLIMVGYNSRELENIINNFDFNLIASRQTMLSSFKNRGIYSINELESVLDDLNSMKGKTKFRDLKFGEDYLLKVVVTDFKSKRPFIIPDDLKMIGIDPDEFKISKAVAMSSSIPFFYNAYKLKDHIFVDGGATMNFPIKLFNDSKNPIIGFRLNNDRMDFIKNLQRKIFKMDDNQVINDVNIIYLKNDIKATQFKKGFSMKDEMYYEGYLKTKEYFDSLKN